MLYSWFQKSGRDLPWRKFFDPYAVWVSEIMLQQTQVERVKQYYTKFMERFPAVRILAGCSWEELLEYWRGLGYYNRARNLHQTARIIMQKYQGEFPSSFEELKTLPGIGSYTAAAIASFAFQQDIPAIDTNIRRIFSRFVGRNSWANLSAKEQAGFIALYLGHGRGRIFNSALMDLGSSVCLARNPRCRFCCFDTVCHSAYKADVSVFPSLSPVLNAGKNPDRSNTLFLKDQVVKKAVRVAVGILIHHGKILISQRLDSTSYGGYWEFPGGKLEQGEDQRICLKREFQEELGIEVAVRPSFYQASIHDMTRNIFISFHRCSLLLGEPQAKQVKTFLWVSPEELLNYRFPPQNSEVITLLQKKKAMFRIQEAVQTYSP